MCFKKLFPNWFKPDIDPIPDTDEPKQIALMFAINNYPGSANDLRGCLNDQTDVANKLNELFPGFFIRQFRDSEVTRSKFISEITNAIDSLNAGDVLLVHYSGHGTQVYDKSGDEADGYDEAVYLYDGTVIDDDIGDALQNIPEGATVVLAFDSCFSGTVTRAILPMKNKYVQNPDIPKRDNKRHRFNKSDMKWIVLSGCSENQTSADAYINGRYNGAFTYYLLKTLTKGITYKEWIDNIHKYLPSNNFNQNPTLEGNESLFNNQVLT